MKGKTHDLNHDLTFSAHTINCVCHSIRSMFRVLGIYNFAISSHGCKDHLQRSLILLKEEKDETRVGTINFVTDVSSF